MWLAGEGRREHDAIRTAAEAAGVFGVPSFVIDRELFWGSEHLPDIRAMPAPLSRFQFAGYNQPLTSATGQGDLRCPPTNNARTVIDW